MRSTMTTTPLVSLKSGQIALTDTNEDVLGRKVVDVNGEDVGKVDDAFVDPNVQRVRFLSVKAGDFLGMGGKTYLIPVDAIQSSQPDTIAVNATKDRILSGPVLDETRRPDTGDTAFSLDPSVTPVVDVYEFYAINEPYWSPTYREPRWA